MSRGNTIFLAALGGAAIAALVANYLQTEKGRELLLSAGETIKDLGGKATELAKNNIGELIQETKDTVTQKLKEKVAEQAMK